MSRGISKRVRVLIDQFHGGSVNDAARTIGVPQRTLSGIVNNEVANPRAAVLTKIATAFRVSLDWLMTGSGEAPDFLAPMMREVMPEFRELGEMLHPLNLKESTLQAFAELPSSPIWAFRLLVQERHVRAGYPAIEAALSAAALHAQGWIVLLKAMIDALGPTVVAAELERQIHAIRLGFSGYAIWTTGEQGVRMGKEHPWEAFEEFRARMLAAPSPAEFQESSSQRASEKRSKNIVEVRR